ncbi:hypothetical protein GCM10010172_06650 [Paractinoplanes ferrugineus]|uniref:Uncharacterized protein n=1 Tax=Paractinoplanes ferrugineus TaxID=113564 RepID=A0A919MQG7_9ACTN|nr:hypothetical protein [Actinoplanes ferrugineus]GIE16307.1 hypothetical protein Afe05nite_81470 [Actinoplanes ferrugineus]
MTRPILYAGANPLGLDRSVRAEVRNALQRFGRKVAESTATLDPPAQRTAVREANVGTASTAGPGRMQLRLIKAGWSLNGNMYPAEVLRKAATDRAWAAGTRCYVDHASDEEEQQHPSGSVKNLAAVLTEDARWDEASQSLIAEARLFEPWRGPLTEMADAKAIGMSIRAWVTGQHGEAGGREGFIVDWVEGRSVDFVTVPAAGGEVMSVLEAVGEKPVVEAANLGAWLESRLHLALTTYADEMYGDGRLTRPERIVLSNAIGDGLQAWTARVEQDAPQLFQRSRWEEPPDPEPAATDGAGTEAAEATQPIEPEAASAQPPTTDVPDGPPPPAPAPPTDEQEEPVSGSQTGAPPVQAGTATAPGNAAPVATPATTTESATFDASAFQQAMTAAIEAATGPLSAQIAQMAARESERDTLMRAAQHRQTATEAVTAALAAAEHGDVRESIRARVTSRVTAAVPATAEGVVDTTGLGELITATIADEATHVRRERANALAEAGVGMPYGMGGTPAQESVEDDGLEDELNGLFSNLGMTSEAAKIAAAGRGR